MSLRDLPFTLFPDGRAALLHPADLSFHELNRTGAAIVASLREGVAVPELVDRLALESGAPRAEVQEAVEAFLTELEAAGFPVAT